MKKTFSLSDSAHKPARVIESIKSDIRKYLKRERRKPLPEGADFWDFTCRVGESRDVSAETHVSELGKKIDSASESQWGAVYVEILAKPGHRIPRKTEDDSDEPGEQAEDNGFE